MEVVVEEIVVDSWQESVNLGQEYFAEEQVLGEQEEIILEPNEIIYVEDREENHPQKSVAVFYDAVDSETYVETNLVNDNLVANHLKCPYCKKTFELRNSLSNHIKSHSALRQFVCQSCGRRFKKEGDQQRHVSLCGREHQFRCELCGKTFMNMNSLTNHVRVHNTDKPFQCPNCDTAFKKQGDMKNHEVVCKSGVLPFSCSICQKRFAAANSLANHILVHQDSTKSIVCNKCGKSFRKAGSHAKHEAHCRNGISLPCEYCDATFPSEEQLNRHMKSHKTDALKCDVCDKTFTHSNGFAKHKKSHAEERFKCPSEGCDQEFKTEYNLKKHCKVHEDPQRLDCHICGRKFGGAWNLKRHILTHTGVKPFQCDSCPKSFTCEKDMLAHRRVHTGKKGFQCPLCPSTFTHLRGLQGHLNIHSEKARLCDQGCGRRFLSEALHDTHSNKCTYIQDRDGDQEELVFRCKICFVQCSDYERIQEHVQNHGEEAKGRGVVISIEKGGAVKEEFTEEINTFVVKVESEEKEGMDYEIESHVKYTIVE